MKAFREGLHERGFTEGRNIELVFRSGEGHFDKIPGLAAELVQLKVDVIVTGGPEATGPSKNATHSIPIVMAQDNDPVGNGFIASLARPGANITGLSALSAEMSGKRLELLKEIVPTLSRVAVFGDSNNPGSLRAFKETEDAARAFAIKLECRDLKSVSAIESAFQAVNKRFVGAVILLPSAVIVSERTRIADLGAKYRLPIIYPRGGGEFVEDGGLMSYAASIPELWRRAANYVDKILKGAKPADLPVEQPTKFEFIINLKAAHQIGLMIPPNVLARADKVIR